METENGNPSITCSGDNACQIIISSHSGSSHAHTLVNNTSAVASSSRDEITRVNEMTSQDDGSLKCELYTYILQDIWDRAQSIYDNFPHMIPIKLTLYGDTSLHVVATANSITFVQELVSLMTPEEMETTNLDGNTAFCMAAISGNSGLFQTMIEKNDNLPLILRHDGKLPVHLAALSGRHRAVKDLSSDNLLEKMAIEDTKQLFFMTISSGMYDVATKLFKKYPAILAIARDDQKQLTALHMLVQKLLQKSAMGDGLQLLRDIWSHVRNLESERILKLITEPSSVVFDALKSGNFNAVEWFLSVSPELLAQKDIDGRNLLHFAALYQEESILDFIPKMGAANQLIWAVDDDHNNILHLAASSSLSPSAVDPVGQLQRKFEWFTKVKNSVPPELNIMKNSKGESPEDILYAHREELVKEMEEEVKRTAKYGMLMATLIVTVVFPAIFNDPGHRNTKSCFVIFIMANLLALLFACASIFCFWSSLRPSSLHKDWNLRRPVLSCNRRLELPIMSLEYSVLFLFVSSVAAVYLIFHKISPSLDSFPSALLLLGMALVLAMILRGVALLQHRWPSNFLVLENTV